jgi:hypothetical protein
VNSHADLPQLWPMLRLGQAHTIGTQSTVHRYNARTCTARYSQFGILFANV